MYRLKIDQMIVKMKRRERIGINLQIKQHNLRRENKNQLMLLMMKAVTLKAQTQRKMSKQNRKVEKHRQIATRMKTQMMADKKEVRTPRRSSVVETINRVIVMTMKNKRGLGESDLRTLLKNLSFLFGI